mgnify:CR=1 FL=1
MKKAVTLTLWLIILMCISFTAGAEEQEPVNVITLASVPATIPYDLTNGVKENVENSVASIIEETPAPQAEIVPREEPVQEFVPVIPHTEEDVYLLAQLINSEAGIESPQCQAYVASVVINRVNSPEFPNTIDGVIFDRKFGVQFSVTLRNKKGHRPIDNTPSEQQIQIARHCLNNGSVLPSDVLVFYSTSCDSGWVTSRKRYTQVDHTIFSYSHK